MLHHNASALLQLGTVSRQLLCFRSPMSREILLLLASGGGSYELRRLYKQIDATHTAVRLHVQSLMEDGYVELCQHPTNRRCKIVQLTDKGQQLMKDYEAALRPILANWR